MKKIIVFDIGGTNIKYGLINDNYDFLEKGEIPTNREAILSQVTELTKQTISKVKDKSELRGIAIATTGVADNINKKIVWTNEVMSDYIGTDFSVLESLFKLPIVLENDANAAAISEKLFNSEIDNYAVVTLGTGVGVGIVRDGIPFVGKNFLGGELGYLHFGNQSLDKYLSYSDQSNKMNNQFQVSIRNHQKFDELYSQNGKFRQEMDIYFDKIVEFCVQLSIYQNLDYIFIGGGFSHVAEKYFNKVKERFNSAISRTPYKTELNVSKSQNNAGMLGVAYHLKLKG